MSSHQPARWRRLLAVTTASAVALLGATGVAAPAIAATAPSATTAAASSDLTGDVSGGTLSWGIKESFRNYVTGPISKGTVETTGGASQASGNGVFTFGSGTGTVEDGLGTIAFAGGVHLTGHGGEMDLTYSDIKVKLTSATTGELILDAKAPKTSQTDAIDLDDAVFAELSFDGSALTQQDGKLTLSAATAELTADGNAAMAGFYSAGTVIDPVSFTSTFTAPEPPKFEPRTTATVTGASEADGLSVKVDGTNYVNLPKTSTGKDAVGVYAALIDHSKQIPAGGELEAEEVIGAQFQYGLTNGSFSKTITAAAAKLDQDTDYDVIVWIAHGTITADTLAYREPLQLTAAQKEDLFPAKFEPRTTATVTGASEADGLSVKVDGTNYVNLPKTSTGKDAVGVYAALIDHSKQIPAGGELEAEEVIGAQFQYGLTNGSFSKTVTAAASKLDQDTDYDVIVWIAHGNITADTLAYREPLQLTAAQKEDLFPAKETTEPSTDPAEPTDVPTTDPAQPTTDPAEPTEVPTTDPAEPTTEPTNPTTGTQTISDATLNWGIKESFRNYVVGNTAKGKFTVADGAEQAKDNGAFSFTKGSGTLKDGKGTIAFKGSVRVTGHAGDMDLTYSDLKVKFTSATTAQLILDATAPKTSRTDAIDLDDVVVADLDFGASALTIDGGKLVLKDAGATLTADGQTALGGFYEAGTEIDPVSINAAVSQADPEDPTKTPTQEPSTPATDDPSDDDEPAGTFEVSDATLNWGIKESFRNYVVGNTAKGKFTVADGAEQAKDNGAFSFTKGSGTLKDGKGTIAFKGSVHVTGHAGAMDLTYSDLKIKFTSATTAQLILDATAPKTSETDAIHEQDIVFADLTFDADAYTIAGVPAAGTTAAAATKVLVLHNATTKLTAQGNTAMAGFYAAGETLDPLSINGKAASVAASVDPDATTPAVENSSDTAVDDQDGATTNGTSQGSDATGGNGTAAAAQQCRTIEVPVTTSQDSASTEQPSSGSGSSAAGGSVSGASLSWGVKSSFVSYTKGGIAKGKVTPSNGAAASGSGFTWGSGSGTISSSGTGTVSFPGKVRFTGHDGIMDTALSGLRVQITGSGSANLIANVASNDMDGNDISQSGIVFATVKFSGSGASGIQNGSVTMTAAGAKAFAGFYSAGQAMDPLTLTVPAAAKKASVQLPAAAATTAAQPVKTVTQVVCGDLASTGSDTMNLIGTAGVLALLGAAAVTFAARRKASEAKRH